MHWWMALWLAAAPGWGEFPRPTTAVMNPEPPVGSPERQMELDEMQAALGEWARERKEAARERARLRELQQEREALQAQGDPQSTPEVDRGPATHGGRRIEPKVIDIAPEPTHEQAEGWLEEEVAKHKAAPLGHDGAGKKEDPAVRADDARTDAQARALQDSLDSERGENVRARRAGQTGADAGEGAADGAAGTSASEDAAPGAPGALSPESTPSETAPAQSAPPATMRPTETSPSDASGNTASTP